MANGRPTIVAIHVVVVAEDVFTNLGLVIFDQVELWIETKAAIRGGVFTIVNGADSLLFDDISKRGIVKVSVEVPQEKSMMESINVLAKEIKTIFFKVFLFPIGFLYGEVLLVQELKVNGFGIPSFFELSLRCFGVNTETVDKKVGFSFRRKENAVSLLVGAEGAAIFESNSVESVVFLEFFFIWEERDDVQGFVVGGGRRRRFVRGGGVG